MNKNLIIGVIILIILVGGAFFTLFYKTPNDGKKIKDSGIFSYDDCVNKGYDSKECEKYTFKRNAELEHDFTEIINQVIQEQAQKEITLSIEEIKVLNLAGVVRGTIYLNCKGLYSKNESEGYKNEEAIVGSIATKLFAEYPDKFAEGSGRDSWAIVDCIFSWQISDGKFNQYVT